MMRALVMDYGKDKKTENISDEYMFGPSLLIAPVYEYGARQREVYFPNTNGWYNFYNGQYIKGGQTMMVDAPYERIPMYVPAGAIIPYGPLMQYTDEKPLEEVTIYVYGGKNGSFTLYEDEGTNYDYERGLYTKIPLTYDQANKTLTIGQRQGSYPGMIENRTFNVIYVDAANPQGYNPDAVGQQVAYNGQAVTVQL